MVCICMCEWMVELCVHVMMHVCVCGRRDYLFHWNVKLYG